MAGRTTIVDLESSIEKAYLYLIQRASFFLDSRHVNKNMSPRLVSNKASEVGIYGREVTEPSKSSVYDIKRSYCAT